MNRVYKTKKTRRQYESAHIKSIDCPVRLTDEQVRTTQQLIKLAEDSGYRINKIMWN